VLAVFVGALIVAHPARASYEEFSTLDVSRQEEDDENLLDHVLVRPPEDWRAEWEGATGAFRSSQGCFTSGQWYLDHELRLRVPMGDTTYMDLNIREVSDDESVYGWTQFDVRFPLPHAGLWGLRFRPLFDKSRQDVAVLWDHGNAHTPLQVQAVFGIEDLFNELWALRQTRVGDDSEPYERHPFEPALRVAWRTAGSHVELNGKWLSPSRKRFDTRDTLLRRTERLWGVKHDASFSQHMGRGTAEVRFEQVQASSYAQWQTRPGDHHLYRRRSRLESAFGWPLGQHGRVTLRYFYQERDQVWRPSLGNSALGVIDRMPMAEGLFRGPAGLATRLGFMRNRVTVTNTGGVPASTWGTRVETRLFFSVQKQFGRVRIQGTECVELDREPYSVVFHHDKGFVHIQTTF
jgi:hypothetical protein